MNATHRARRHLEAAARDYPHAWAQFDAFRGQREELGGWPDYVFCPMAGAYAVVSGGGPHRVSLERAGDISRVAALAAWRPTQGIYRFDPDLRAALVATPPTGELPCEVLRYLPAWCVYVEASAEEQAQGFHGFFAHLEYDTSDHREELRLVLDLEGGLLPIPLHLGPWDLRTALDEAGRKAREQAVLHGAPAPGSLTATAPVLAPLLSLVLYLCVAEGDFEREPRPQAARTKKGPRLFPPDRPRTWEVGTRIGAALRRAASDHRAEEGIAGAGRASPRPHVRSAHWATYWTGPKSAPQVPKVRWIAPVGVRLELGADIPAVVKPVIE